MVKNIEKENSNKTIFREVGGGGKRLKIKWVKKGKLFGKVKPMKKIRTNKRK